MVSGLTINVMGWVFTNGVTEGNFMVSGLRTTWKASVSTLTQMGSGTMDNIRQIRKMDMAFTSGQMEGSTKDGGRKANSTASALIQI